MRVLAVHELACVTGAGEFSSGDRDMDGWWNGGGGPGTVSDWFFGSGGTGGSDSGGSQGTNSGTAPDATRSTNETPKPQLAGNFLVLPISKGCYQVCNATEWEVSAKLGKDIPILDVRRKNSNCKAVPDGCDGR